MKPILSFFFLVVFACLVNAQVKLDKTSDVFNYNVLEHKPLFAGANNHEESESLLRNYVQSRIDSANFNEGLIAYISFVIDTDGYVIRVEVSYGKDSQLNQAAVEIISNLPKWQPARKNGEVVKSSFLLDIKT